MGAGASTGVAQAAPWKGHSACLVLQGLSGQLRSDLGRDSQDGERQNLSLLASSGFPSPCDSEEMSPREGPALALGHLERWGVRSQAGTQPQESCRAGLSAAENPEGGTRGSERWTQSHLSEIMMWAKLASDLFVRVFCHLPGQVARLLIMPLGSLLLRHFTRLGQAKRK